MVAVKQGRAGFPVELPALQRQTPGRLNSKRVRAKEEWCRLKGSIRWAAGGKGPAKVTCIGLQLLGAAWPVAAGPIIHTDGGSTMEVSLVFGVSVAHGVLTRRKILVDVIQWPISTVART